MDTEIKHKVLQSWQERAACAREKLAQLEDSRAYHQYELEITRRVLAKAQNDGERETWQTEAGILEAAVEINDYEQHEQRAELALCATMIAELEADLGS